MDELGKVKRVIEKQAPVTEVLLVLDATTGQNGLIQARVFSEVVDVTGIVLTKLDGSAKGGIVVAVQRELGVPVKLVGLGEGPDDLAPFDAARVRRRPAGLTLAHGPRSTRAVTQGRDTRCTGATRSRTRAEISADVTVSAQCRRGPPTVRVAYSRRSELRYVPWRSCGRLLRLDAGGHVFSS